MQNILITQTKSCKDTYAKHSHHARKTKTFHGVTHVSKLMPKLSCKDARNEEKLQPRGKSPHTKTPGPRLPCKHKPCKDQNPPLCFYTKGSRQAWTKLNSNLHFFKLNKFSSLKKIWATLVSSLHSQAKTTPTLFTQARQLHFPCTLTTMLGTSMQAQC